MNQDLSGVAAALAARGKGILAADDTPGALIRRFDALGIPSTEQTADARQPVDRVEVGRRCDSVACFATYTDELEHTLFTGGAGAPHRELRDD